MVDVRGYCDPAFEKVRKAFVANFSMGKERGAGVAIVIGGNPVVNIWAGAADFFGRRPWQENTLANIYSATKGVTAVCAHRLVEEGRLDLDRPVAVYWPGFEKNGKEAITVRMLLNHTAGMVALKRRQPAKALYDWKTMTGALEAQSPWWRDGTLGYHPLTYGWLVGQLIRNITGMSVGQYLKKEITGPLGLDLHIGLDASHHHRCATMIMLRVPTIHMDCIRFAAEMITHPFGATSCAFGNPVSIATGVNTPAWRSAEIPSANGQATALALARLYGVLANGGTQGNIRVLSPESIDRCIQETSGGPDAILKLRTRFSLGFMLNQDNPSGNMGPGRRSFGHPGAGGALGFADPDAKMGFGYVINKMDTFILVDPRARRLIDAAYECL
ncbi:MAG: serine hydrolase domain-containing protein [Thermodesulfobacteriota bacterium]